ncbi:hypothetical protein HPP92_011996 [Vanilla planifolia]|uniref:Uncharacterized protein n=1 Tax=Vanilla planifolia TaxID=51239 RepID=A0A835R064_VANPL|nr:hypothetical protein HPP92_011996 [Vanilla planifolia]
MHWSFAFNGDQQTGNLDTRAGPTTLSRAGFGDVKEVGGNEATGSCGEVSKRLMLADDHHHSSGFYATTLREVYRLRKEWSRSVSLRQASTVGIGGILPLGRFATKAICFLKEHVASRATQPPFCPTLTAMFKHCVEE